MSGPVRAWSRLEWAHERRSALVSVANLRSGARVPPVALRDLDVRAGDHLRFDLGRDDPGVVAAIDHLVAHPDESGDPREPTGGCGTTCRGDTGRAEPVSRARTIHAPVTRGPDERPILVAGRAARILVVEEDQSITRLMERVLSRAGAHTTTLHDGDAALALLDAEPFDLVWLDFRMPGLDGLDVAQRVRDGTGPNAATPLILETGSPDIAARHARPDLLDCIVATPFTPDLMLGETAWHLEHPSGCVTYLQPSERDVEGPGSAPVDG